MAAKNKVKPAKTNESKLKMFLWGLLALILKVVGIAFLIQGFVMQLATGILYYGMLHYALGIILIAIAWRLICKKYCYMCQ